MTREEALDSIKANIEDQEHNKAHAGYRGYYAGTSPALLVRMRRSGGLPGYFTISTWSSPKAI